MKTGDQWLISLPLNHLAGVTSVVAVRIQIVDKKQEALQTCPHITLTILGKIKT